MKINGYNHFGGVNSELAALRNALAHYGVAAPHTGQPFTEAMLYGLNGGVGAAYFNFEYEGYPPSLFIGLNARYRTKPAELLQTVCRRLQLETVDKTTRSPAAAARHLTQSLGRNYPVIVYLVLGELPYYPLQGVENNPEYAAVVFEFDETTNKVLLGDLAPAPLRVTPAQLAQARAASGPLQNRSLAVIPPAQTLDLPGLQTALTEAIAACCRSMLTPPAPKGNFGLNALQKWADLVADPKDPKGWPAVFPPGADLYHALQAVFFYVELNGTGGGAARGALADFLAEAGPALNKPALADAAARYRAAAELWRNLAEAALPDSVPLFAEAKNLARRKHRLFLAQGSAARPEMQTINHRQSEIGRVAAEAFPLSPAQVGDLLASLRDCLRNIHRAETEAIAALQAAAA